MGGFNTVVRVIDNLWNDQRRYFLDCGRSIPTKPYADSRECRGKSELRMLSRDFASRRVRW